MHDEIMDAELKRQQSESDEDREINEGMSQVLRKQAQEQLQNKFRLPEDHSWGEFLKQQADFRNEVREREKELESQRIAREKQRTDALNKIAAGGRWNSIRSWIAIGLAGVSIIIAVVLRLI